MNEVEIYRGKVVDEDEYVQGILIGEDKIFQYTEDSEWSVNCGIGCFSVNKDSIEPAGKVNPIEIKVLPNMLEVKDYLKSLPKIYLVACWASYGVMEFPFANAYKYSKRADKEAPLVWQHDDCNGTCDLYFLRSIVDTTSGSINCWTFDKKEAEEIAENKNKKWGMKYESLESR